MSQLLEIVSDGTAGGGWTGRLEFTAKADGVGVDLTGLTVTAQLRGFSQAAYVDTVGDVVLDNQTTNPGGWFLDADPTDFTYLQSPYSIRLKVVDGVGKTVYFSSAVEADTIAVGRP